MGDPRTLLAKIAREKSDYRITATLVDALGAGIPAGNLLTVTLTLYVLDAAKTIINSADHADIKNVGRGTIDASGNLILTLGPNDNPILDTTLFEEHHVALIEWTYNGGASAGRHELEFAVRNLARVT